MRNESAVFSDCNSSTVENTKYKMLFVLVVVFIFCSGNALGILLGAVIWVKTARMALAIGVLIGLSILGLLMALLVALYYFRSVAHRAKAAQSRQEQTEAPRQDASE